MAASVMEQPASYNNNSSRRREEPPDFNLTEWGGKARMLSRENTNSRRFSASHIRSFRELESKSFRTNFTISSTASSPGYPVKEEIDPSTYSFTTALKALQRRAAYNTWECLSPDGFALNSKWNEAEKYICNPLSGEFPMECLSAKTLSARSFRNIANRITISAPLVYSSARPIQITKPSVTPKPEITIKFPAPAPIPEKKIMECMSNTRDVGTQSIPPGISSGSPSPASTPSIVDRALKRSDGEKEDSPVSNPKLKLDEEEVEEKEKVKEQEEKEEEEEEEEEEEKEGEERLRKADKNKRDDKASSRQGGCLSWMRKRNREKHKSRKRHSSILPEFIGC